MARDKQERSYLRIVGAGSAGACVLGVVAATQLHMEQGWILAGGAGLVTLACAGIGVAVRKRMQASTRLGAVLQTEFGADWNQAAGLKMKGFKGGVPRKIVITYPPRMPDHDPRWRAKIRDIVWQRMDAHAVREAWDPAKSRVIFEVVEASSTVAGGPVPRVLRATEKRLGAGLDAVLGAEWDPAEGLEVSDYRGDEPWRITLTYPARMPDHDPRWRAKVRELMRQRMGADAVKDTWDPTSPRGYFERVEWSAQERVLREADARIGAGLDVLLGAEWDPSEGMTVDAYEGTAPRKVTISYPPRMPDHDQDWRGRVEELVRQRMGADDVTATWVPSASRVVIVGIDWATAEREHKSIERRIQKVLTPLFRGASHLDVSVPAWSAESFPLRINLDYGTITQDASEIFQRRVEVTAGVKIGGRWRAMFDPRTDSGYLEPRPELATNVPHPGVSLYTDPDPKAPVLYYGVDEDGNARGWTIGKKSTMPHCLTIGPTGGGKTTVLRSLVVGAVLQGIPVFMCDPKRVELTPFRGFPGCFVASSQAQMEQMIAQMEALMSERYEAIEMAINRGEEPPSYSPVLFILDELLILRQVMKWAAASQVAETDTKKGANPAKPAKKRPWHESIAALLALARTAQINLVIGVQRPDASLFEDGSRDNLRQRISLMRLSAQGSQMTWGSPYVGVDLPMTQGRAMASPDGDTPIEMQTYWVADPISAEGADREVIEEVRANADAIFADFVPPVDVSDYLGRSTDPDEQPTKLLRTLAEIDLGVREDDAMAATAAWGVAGLDVDDVQADALTAGDEDTPGDRILYNDEPCEVLAVDEDFTGMVTVTIRTGDGEEQLQLAPDEFVPRVLDLELEALGA